MPPRNRPDRIPEEARTQDEAPMETPAEPTYFSLTSDNTTTHSGWISAIESSDFPDEIVIPPDETSNHKGKVEILPASSTRGIEFAHIWVSKNNILNELTCRLQHRHLDIAYVLGESSIDSLPIIAQELRKCPCCAKFTSEHHTRLGMCQECARKFVICYSCHRTILRDDANFNRRDTPMCSECITHNGLGECTRCGRWTDQRDADSGGFYCQNCAEMERRERQQLEGRSGIRDHGYKPPPQFKPEHKPKTLYFGIELETDRYLDTYKAASRLLEHPEFDKLFYMKHDGSLHNGIEIVTHPCTLDYHRTKFPWKEITDLVKEMGGRSHYTNTCGLHIHFNEDYLGDSVKERDANALKLFYLPERHWGKLLRFSRRMPSQVHWTPKHNQKFQQYTMEQYKYFKQNHSKHTVMNNRSKTTIEVRLFRGTLNVTTLLASIELLDYLVHLVKKRTPKSIYRMTWTKLVAGINPAKYPNLDDYLKRKKLKEGSPKSAPPVSNPED